MIWLLYFSFIGCVGLFLIFSTVERSDIIKPKTLVPYMIVLVVSALIIFSVIIVSV